MDLHVLIQRKEISVCVFFFLLLLFLSLFFFFFFFLFFFSFLKGKKERYFESYVFGSRYKRTGS